MSTPTPRTDAATALTSQHRYDDSFGDPEFGWVTAGFARELERELAFQVARNSRLFAQRDEAVEAQEKAEAELAAERARLDWLESPAGMHWQWQAGITRATIDAKMQKDAK